MKNKKKILFSSIMVIALCLSLIAGSTFALFTSESHVNIAVTSGKVNVDAEIKNPKIYSATVESKDEQNNAYEVAGEITSGNHAATYYYEPLTVTTDSETGNFNGVFTNTGKATYTATTNKLDLDRVTPGDRIDFDVEIANNSNVNIQYRVIVTVNSGLKIFNKMKVYIDGVNLNGVNRTGNWQNWAVSENADDMVLTVPVKIYLPIDLDGEEYMNQSTSMTVSVEAVQGNAKTTNETLTTSVSATEEVTTSDKKVSSDTTIADDDGLVEVKIPSGTTLTSDETALAVKVTPQETVSKITVLSTQASASYDVSVLKIVNGEISKDKAVDNNNNEKEITVKMFIGTGLTGVILYHNDEEIDYEEYDSDTGYITFKTTSFSEYTVLYNANYAYETDDGIVVLKATETTGVYLSKDGEGNEIKVSVVEDEDGNVTETTGKVFVVSKTATTAYDDLATALAEAKDGDTAILQDNLTSDDGISFNKANAKVKLDLNGHTFTVNSGSNVNSRAFRIDNGTLDVYNGTVDAKGSENAGCFGAFRVEDKGTLYLTDITLKNYRKNGLNVKVLGGNAYLDNVTINSVYGGGIEVTNADLDDSTSKAGYAEIKNSTFDQKLYGDWCSTCISVSGGSKVVVNSGTYTSENYALYVFSSGGEIEVNGGTFVAKDKDRECIRAELDTNTYPEYTGGLKIKGGNYTGSFTVTSPAYMSITGGIFEKDPTAYLADGYAVYENENDLYEVYKPDYYVESVKENEDGKTATVTYKDTVKGLTKTEQVRYLTVENVGTQTTDTTFDIYCGDELIVAGAAFTNLFNTASANTQVLIGKNAIKFPAGNIYFNGDSYINSESIFVIGSTDAEGKPTTKFLANGSASVSYKGLQFQNRDSSFPTRRYYFENIVFDGSAQQNKWGHLVTMTCYGIEAQFNNVVFANMTQANRTSVIGVWANDTPYPTYSQNKGVNVRFFNCKVENCNNKPIVQFQDFTSDVIAANPDCYSYIAIYYDKDSETGCGFNSANAYTTQSGNNNAVNLEEGRHATWTVNGVEVIVNGTTVTLPQ